MSAVRISISKAARDGIDLESRRRLEIQTKLRRWFSFSRTLPRGLGCRWGNYPVRRALSRRRGFDLSARPYTGRVSGSAPPPCLRCEMRVAASQLRCNTNCGRGSRVREALWFARRCFSDSLLHRGKWSSLSTRTWDSRRCCKNISRAWCPPRIVRLSAKVDLDISSISRDLPLAEERGAAAVHNVDC